MISYLTIAVQTLERLARPAAHERNEVNESTSEAMEGPDTSFVSFVSFVPTALHAGAESIDWQPDGRDFDGFSGQLLATLWARAGMGDAKAAEEAILLADYFAACDRGEVRWPAHPLDEDLDRWNRSCRSNSHD